MAINTQTSFQFGQIGDRLDFNRSSEVFLNSAKEIKNGYISPLGTLRIMKDIELFKDLAKTVVQVLETSGGFQLVAFANEIRLIDNNTSDTISSLVVTKSITLNTNIHISRRVGSEKDIDNKDISPFFFISLCYEDETNEYYKCDEDGKNISVYDFLTKINKPLNDRVEVFVDAYRIYTDAEVNYGAADTDVDPSFKGFLTLEKVESGFQNPIISVDENGVITIDTISGEVKRIYFEKTNSFETDKNHKLKEQTSRNDLIDIYIPQTQEDGTKEDGIPDSWNDLKHGDVILNFYNNVANDPDKPPMLLLFNELTFEGLTKPVDEPDNVLDATAGTKKFGGLKEYYTHAKLSVGKAKGRILQGNIVDLNNKIVAVNVFQNRLCLMTEDTLYFSRVAEFEDFTNGVDVADPFFNKLSPISNIEPKIITSYSSRGLFVMTDRGIVAVNYQRSLTPATVSVDTVSDIPCSKQVEMIDYNLFYVGADKQLYCVQEDTENISSRLYSFKVEKFQLEQNISFLSKIRIDKDFRLIAIEESETTEIKLYSAIDVDTFSNVSYEIPHNGVCYGIKNSFFIENGRYDLSTKNKKFLNVKIHQPETFTDAGGSLFNDINTYIYKFSGRVINSDNDQIVSFGAGGEYTVQLGTNLGRSSLYDLEVEFPVLDGIDMSLELKDGSTGIVELQGIEYMYEPNGRY